MCSHVRVLPSIYSRPVVSQCMLTSPLRTAVVGIHLEFLVCKLVVLCRIELIYCTNNSWVYIQNMYCRMLLWVSQSVDFTPLLKFVLFMRAHYCIEFSLPYPSTHMFRYPSPWEIVSSIWITSMLRGIYLYECELHGVIHCKANSRVNHSHPLYMSM